MVLLSKTECSIFCFVDAEELNIEIITEFKKQKQTQSCTVTQTGTRVADNRKQN